MSTNKPTNNSNDDDEDDNTWQYVSQKRKSPMSPIGNHSKRQQIEVILPSHNRFSSLDNNDDEPSTSNNASQREPRPPPIFIPGVSNINKMITDLSKVILIEDFNFKALNNNQIRLMIKNVTSYRKVIKHFDTLKLKYHTYQLKEDRAFRFVIKGLHHTTNISDIKARLLSLGHQVRSVRNVVSRKTKEPLPMFFVDLDPCENNKDVYDIRSIENAVVSIEPPKRFDDLVQCFRCQEFGHTKSYCKKPFRCVKCGGDHSTIDCTKPADVAPKCVHCKNNHTASYKGCPTYQKLANKRTTADYRQTNNRTAYYAHPPVGQYDNRSQDNGLTYADILRNQPQREDNLLSKIEAMLAKQIELTTTLMNMMSMLMSKLCK